MRSARSHVPGSRRRRGAALVAVLTAVAFVVVSSPGVSWAARAGAGPVPTHLAVTGLVSTVVTPPGAAGAPAALMESRKPFSLTVQMHGDDGLPYAVSATKATRVTVEVAAGASRLVGGVAIVVIPAGGHTATFPELVVAPAANDVRLAVKVTAGTRAALGLAPATTAAFDVVVSSHTEPVADRGRSQLVSRDGVDKPCSPTPDIATCVDLLLPNGVASDVFFSTGVCDGAVGCAAGGREVLQVLADLGPAYNHDNPATIVVKCDKSLCSGGGVPSYQLKVNLDPTGPLADAPACVNKGVIQVGVTSCLDYAQSRRDGAGDLLLFWLVPRDARGSCC